MHGLDINDGVASFVGRQSAWHSLGEATGEAFTAEVAMTKGHLGNWKVRKVPMLADVPKVGQIKVPGRMAVVRDNPVTKGQVDVLGDVGENYHVIQNEEHAAFLNALIDESGAHFETAGAIRGGSQTFLTMKMPGHIMVGGVDQVDNYIGAVNSHDGSLAFSLMVTPIQMVCQNTVNLAFKHNNGIFRIRHSSGAGKVLHSKAREALDMTFKYLDGFQEEADKLINTTMTSAAFEQILRNEFGVPEDSSNHTISRSEKKIEEIQQLFEEAETVAAKRNTAWGGLAALTEWADHYSPTRGTDDAVSARSQRALLDPKFKNRALQLMLAAV